MDTSKQAEKYNKIAEHWAGNNFNQENGIEQHKRALRLAQTSGNAIDIGCGSSGRIIDLMLSQGFIVEGLDYAEEMLKLAKLRNPNVEFHHADICNWKPRKKYDFISAWDSIWHVPLEFQESVLRKLLASLNQGGLIIFTSGAVDNAGDGSNPFIGQELYHAALGIPMLLTILADTDCICRHLENDDWPNQHLYIIAQRAYRRRLMPLLCSPK